MKQKILLLLNLLTSLSCLSQSGFLDETFGDNGKVYTDLVGQCYTMALQPDGKILAGGIANKGIPGRRILIRYLPDGEVDSLFGEEGIVTLPDFNSMRTVQILEDGKILAGGAIFPRIAIAKLKPDGALDSTFGKDGIFSSEIGGITPIPFAMQLQLDGKIVLGGRLETTEDHFRMVIVRVNGNGTSLDSGFGAGGTVIVDAGYQCNTLAIQADGKILAGGQLWPTGGGDQDKFFICRYNTDGSADESFGANGSVFTDITEDGNDVLSDLVLLSDGKFVAGGLAHYLVETSGGSYMVAVKYNSDGLLDESFGEMGIAKVIFEDVFSEATGLLLQPDGKLILTGSMYESNGQGDFALARLKINGILDSSFAVNGKQITEIGDYARSRTSALQQDGKIILAGDEGNSGNYALARYNGDQIEKPWFAKIRKWLHQHGFTWDDWPFKIRSYSVERSADGIHFNEIARIVNTANQSNLSYEDNAPLSGINYYRLRAESIDGSVAYSNVIGINDNTISVHLYPNPVKDVLNIKGLDAGMSYEISVMNAKGSIVAKTAINNTSSYSWNLQSLSKGVYYLHLRSTNDNATTIKIVKQ